MYELNSSKVDSEQYYIKVQRVEQRVHTFLCYHLLRSRTIHSVQIEIS